jgi:xanthine dehydrogenase YagS FAD-binding subunit
MRPFTYERAATVDEALRALGPETRFLAGGTNLIDLMKCDVEHARRLVDINRLPLAKIEPLGGDGLRIGAMVRNSDCAADARVRERYPLLAQALLSGASQQLRNMASMGGNLLQRTRCYYFYEASVPRCNKRQPGSGCAARDGYNRNHAILGASEQCVATHPSDMAVALTALDATVVVQGASATRRIPMIDFHRLPGKTPERDTHLGDDELIVAIELPPNAFAAHSHYLKVRDRASYEFAAVSVAAALDVRDGRIHEARIALGGVAHKPWRVPEAERALAGQPLDASPFQRAADLALKGAQPLEYNAFKVELARRSIVRALATAGGIA